MTILSEAEIEKLKQTHPKKKILRWFFLISGLIITILGLFLFIFGVDFGFEVEDVNLSILVDIMIIIIGLIIASKYFIAPYYLRENSITIKSARNLREIPLKEVRFSSYDISRLFAALILIIIGIISFITFGMDVGHEVEYGSAVVLGGPSFFYLTGLPMFIIGICLFLYFVLSIFRGKFSVSENFYFFYEIRPGFSWLTEIPKKDIEAIRFQNNHLGPKLSWIVLFIPFIVLQLMTGIPLFFVDKAGPEYVLSWSFLIYSLVEIIVLIILVLFQPHYFEIATKDMLYEMWFSPIKFRNQKKVKDDFKDLFGYLPRKVKLPNDRKQNGEITGKNLQNDIVVSSQLNKTHFQLFQLLFGMVLVIMSSIMITQMILFGPFVWWIALTYGIILIIRAINHDFSKNNGDEIQYNIDLQKFTLCREFMFKFQYMMFDKVKSVKITKWYRKLDFFDFVGLGGLIIFLTIQQFEGWVLANSLGLILDNIISTIVLLIIMILVFLFIFLPINVIELNIPSITYRINITLKKEDRSYLKSFKSNIYENFKAIFRKELKRTCYIRLIVIFVLILGVCIYMVFYFLFIF